MPATLTMACTPAISAIYYALLQCGYTYYALDRTPAHAETIRQFKTEKSVPAFFSEVQQNTCAVYPYWPRAAILELAACCQDASILHEHIMSASNIVDAERDDRLWTWLDGFPGALEDILHRDGFHHYLAWLQDWLSKQQELLTQDLHTIQECIAFCDRQSDSCIRHIQIVLDPIKCIYSSDHHIFDGRFLFCSGRFDAASIIHEYLHHVVHPHVIALTDQIGSQHRTYPGLDASYLAAGSLNAFEEHAVRSLTCDLTSRRFPHDLPEYLVGLLSSGKISE